MADKTPRRKQLLRDVQQTAALIDRYQDPEVAPDHRPPWSLIVTCLRRIATGLESQGLKRFAARARAMADEDAVVA
jgi:hypothetical protein